MHLKLYSLVFMHWYTSAYKKNITEQYITCVYYISDAAKLPPPPLISKAVKQVCSKTLIISISQFILIITKWRFKASICQNRRTPFVSLESMTKA